MFNLARQGILIELIKLKDFPFRLIHYICGFKKKSEMSLICKEESYKIIGACMNVHNELGCGFLEAVYQEALAIEFIRQNIPFEQEKELPIYYLGNLLKKKYNADFICYNKIIVETKASSGISGNDESQVINYLKATGFKLGLLVNFGLESLEHKRLVRL
jgi:GxxExxY protein